MLSKMLDWMTEIGKVFCYGNCVKYYELNISLVCRSVLLMVIFSQLLGRYHIPCFMYVKDTGCQMRPLQLFKMFPVGIGCC